MSIEPIYTRGELTTLMRRRERIKARAILVECQRLDAIAYQDLLALYLRLAGVRHWQWRDGAGNMKPGAPLYKTLAALGRDLAPVLRQPGRRRCRTRFVPPGEAKP